jgi:hypothetical protein
MVDVLRIEEKNINLKLIEAAMGRGLGSSEEVW